MVLDGIVLRRQAEGVEADGKQDVIALHPLFAADDIHRREGPRVADVQALAGGVRKFNQPVELFPGRIRRHGGVGLLLFPNSFAICARWQ